MLGPHRFRFLNADGELRPGGWDDPALERLWRYNLHYFDDLNACDAASRQQWHGALLTRWIHENPAGQGTPWEPYPTSLRVVNWVKWFVSGQVPEQAWLDSLAIQVRWLCGRLEWHLLGNHLFANAKALVAAGLYFRGAEADHWLDRGMSILERQIPEQILADGGQFERSPMYHALALEDVLDLLNLSRARSAADHPARQWQGRLSELASRMLQWLLCMTHGGSRLALFNDCADGIAPPLAELQRYAAALGVDAPPPRPGTTALLPSGYVCIRQGRALLIADVAPIGPDYLVGHAHADTLAFELSLGAQALVMNGGTSCYGVSARRLAERSTAAHSTVEVAGQSSSEVWSGFRVGRRARPFGLNIVGQRVSCSHDGYCHLAGRPVHQRVWDISDGQLWVEDRLSWPQHAAIARFPLSPGLVLQRQGDAQWQVLRGSTTVATVDVEAGIPEVTPTTHAERFGVVTPNQTLTVRLSNGRAATRWRWNPDAHPVSH